MKVLTRDLWFESCKGNEKIYVKIIEPEDRTLAKAVVQIAHGMAEHSMLYLDFANYLASNGYAVAINDHLGHGKSVSSGGAYGYFGKGGAQNMVIDMHKLYAIMREEYPEIPYFLLGHSMGSFLARSYSAQYGEELSGAIYLGTGAGPGKNLLTLQLRIADYIVKKKGPMAHDALFEKFSTERFNKAFSPNRTGSDWLSRDKKEVDQYERDPLCGFPLTASGYRDILKLQSQINSPSWYQALPDIPILMVSGDKDPLGDFGKGIKKIARELKRTGHHVQVILYPQARHVVLCETNKEQVYHDIHQFLEEVLVEKQRKKQIK